MGRWRVHCSIPRNRNTHFLYYYISERRGAYFWHDVRIEYDNGHNFCYMGGENPILGAKSDTQLSPLDIGGGVIYCSDEFDMAVEDSVLIPETLIVSKVG